MKNPFHAWLFDVDGVILNLFERKVTSPQIIKLISQKLSKGEPVSLTTGRSIEWLKERILHFFEKQDKDSLTNLFISAEKGGVFGSYNSQNELNVKVDQSLKVPGAVSKEIEELINEEFSQAVFFDKPKNTMLSIEMHENLNLEEFKKIQPKLDAALAEILSKHHLDKKFRIDSVIISTDVENIRAGKDLGARRFLDWLKSKDIHPQNFYAFGDNASDAKMAQAIYIQGKKVTFVFVGKEELLKGKSYKFPIVTTNSLYEKGTLEYLTSVT